jgi:endonuclease YncB( thermonuclease family)
MAIAAPAAKEVLGRASVIDGDTIEIHGQRIRFFGIDAPESNQVCELPPGTKYRCGQKSALALADLISDKTVRCIEKDRDLYKRIVGECFIDSINLNAWMVSQGWALAYRQYSKAFIIQEEEAKTAKVGIWAGTFQMPWDFRHNPATVGSTPTSKKAAEHGDCLIKGNISSKNERIYHVPGTSWYNKTKIDTAKGERWFCSEDEAQAAGWRKAMSK